TFKSFKATVINEEVHLEWVTTLERDNHFFSVERTLDGKTFTTLDSVQGAGTIEIEQSYSWVDRMPYGGFNYYRIKQTDFDGQFSYSKLVAARVIRSEKDDLRLYPNPAKDYVV